MSSRTGGDRVSAALDQVVQDLELEIGSAGGLRKDPGIHRWQIRHPNRSGAVEVSFWPEELRLWVTVHRGREGSWGEEGSRWLAEELARALGTLYEQVREDA